ncbi:MotA/TolQ/ExbB proton channel family protein [Vibrio casei]|uniref:MotA/TolQ/ExbB proton channel family protein n=1 Tax=Vibrio casei TaxID=673372 RepID=A0A368LP94_9VIBR|nr:MotA/TolQ/ExbB proton channel family protein [Vibrio casei]RCS73658.1 MotA/TolQ/ExbB proton channel family protein [Vibrio casei]SJN16500.1 Ferric siderophore transport system, biopolymer transport protein ExbB [Vibrio casei]
MFTWLSTDFPNLFSSNLAEFMAGGGQVLWWLAAIVMLCWVLIIERILFLSFSYRVAKVAWIGEWKLRKEHDSWYALAQKEGMLQQAHVMLTQHLDLIKALVSLCPMLGLLGTVTGMIAVFDLMSLSGSSDPKLMASGISMATLPTMAGMVAALAGMFAHSRLVKVATRKEMHLEQQLRSGE